MTRRQPINAAGRVLLLALAAAGSFSCATAGGGPRVSSLPLLLAKAIAPIKDRERFKFEHSWKYLDLAKRGSSGVRWETDDQAARASIDFLAEHFGPLPDPLEVTRVTRSAGGGSNDDGTGHTVVLHARHRGVRLEDSFAVVYLAGRVVCSASVQLVSVKPIAGSEKAVLSESKAVAIWKEGVEKGLKIQDPKPGAVELQYVWSAVDEQPPDRSQGEILRPNWAITFSGGGGELLVDAFTGRLWRND